uniref:Conotoxin Im14.2 n=2 Tax=Conus TaxID=6490 RepID=CUE2_CONIM|nr:RecName: Full=Conotoxin Im14.2; AltName: Full=Conopeptide im025; Flags: Precursor [Conus imperialis]AME17683.1 conopeptide im025 [Conus imperialis]QFQ61144.1 superfamily Rimp-01 [Conus magus]
MARFLSILLCFAMATGLAAGIRYPDRVLGRCSTHDLSKMEIDTNLDGVYSPHRSFCTCGSGEVYFTAKDRRNHSNYRVYVCGMPTEFCTAENPVRDPKKGNRWLQCRCRQYKMVIYRDWLVLCE